MDNKKVKSLVLSNQRRFTFSFNYDELKLNEYIVEARVLYRTIMDLPILPNLASDLEDELIRRSIFGTAAIEGNPLTEKQVDILVESEDKTNPVKRAEHEILNLRKTYLLLDQMVNNAKNNNISESDFITIHKEITLGINYSGNTPGKYRNHQVKVGDISHGGIYTPPYITRDIKRLMNEIVEWLNSNEILELNPIVRAALAHFHFSIIHPFGDGNGRVARAIEAYLLRLSNIKYLPMMLSNYYYKNIDEYYWTFSKTLKEENKDVTLFIEFVLKGFVESLHEIKERITYYIRKFTLRDYYTFLKEKGTINKRQFELMNILLKHYLEFTIKDLAVVTPFSLIYSKLSEKTLSRDVHILLTLNLIKEVGKKKYGINMKVLG